VSAARTFVLGTDTDVGKTRVTAALALALARGGHRPTIVKPIQTGLAPHERGDAVFAAGLAGVPHAELRRYALPADPWSAALAAGAPPPRAADLARELDELAAAAAGPLVIEGAGGVAVPLSADETFLDLAAALEAPALVVIGLRLGCISHARLTLEALRARGVPIAGALLVARFAPADPEHVRQVWRALDAHVAVLGVAPYEPDDARGAAATSALLGALVEV